MSIVRIMTLGDYLQGDTVFTSRQLMLFRAVESAGQKDVPPEAGWLTRAFTGSPSGEPLVAYIEGGWGDAYWTAHCECGGSSEVDPADPVFFCDRCRNEAVGGVFRPVVFPENREQVEAEVIEKAIRESACTDPEGEMPLYEWLNWTPEQGYLGLHHPKWASGQEW